MLTKKHLRDKISLINVLDMPFKSAQIFDKIRNIDDYLQAKNVFVFMSLAKEPDTSYIIKDSFNLGKTVFVPVAEDEISFVEIDEHTKFFTSKYSVKEPLSSKSKGQMPKDNDIILVPMVAFDRGLNRLGHGKGYYDKFLAKTNAKKIGITFSDYELKCVLAVSHDVKMDMIITDKEIIDENNRR